MIMNYMYEYYMCFILRYGGGNGDFHQVNSFISLVQHLVSRQVNKCVIHCGGRFSNFGKGFRKIITQFPFYRFDPISKSDNLFFIFLL